MIWKEARKGISVLRSSRDHLPLPNYLGIGGIINQAEITQERRDGTGFTYIQGLSPNLGLRVGLGGKLETVIE